MPVSLSVVLVVAFQEILTFASKQALVIVSSLNFEKNMGRSRGNFHANDEDPTQRFALFFHKIDFLNVTVFCFPLHLVLVLCVWNCCLFLS